MRPKTEEQLLKRAFSGEASVASTRSPKRPRGASAVVSPTRDEYVDLEEDTESADTASTDSDDSEPVRPSYLARGSRRSTSSINRQSDAGQQSQETPVIPTEAPSTTADDTKPVARTPRMKRSQSPPPTTQLLNEVQEDQKPDVRSIGISPKNLGSKTLL